MKSLSNVLNFATELVYPRHCAGCRRRGTWLCMACDADLPGFTPPLCAGCGVPAALRRCQCDSTPSDLSRVRSVGPYAGWLREAIIRFKYEGEWARAEHFGPLLAQVVLDLVPSHGLVPVPLHPRRYRQRGFNQSRLLAEHVGRLVDIDVRDLLVRQRMTDPQARLGAAARVVNVEDAFALRRDAAIAGQDFVLIDDVITTGSTLAACAKVLRDAGAREVSVATLAREIETASAL